MSHCWELKRWFGLGKSAATVFPSGTWFTWDRDGNGGENSKQDHIELAKTIAHKSAISQRFI